MSTFENLCLRTDVLGYPVEDAKRAMLRAGGDVNRAADILLEGGLRRRNTINTATTPREKVGPSRALPTPPSTASPETITIGDSDDNDNDSNEGFYAPPTPTPASRAASTSAANYANYVARDEEYECEDDQDDLYAPPTPTDQRGTPRARDATKSIQGHNHTSHVSNDALDEFPQCVCTEPNNDEMIQCTTCQRWFHYECVQLTPATIPHGEWFCHLEHNSSTKPYNNSGNRMNDLESRALYLTVRHLAPLGSRFWEHVSAHMRTHFNILRSVTSVKMEWLRYSSAWWGFDERNCTQYREEDSQARRSLFRSTQKDAKMPPLLWYYMGMPMRKPAEESEGEPKQRKPRKLVKPAGQAKTPKRKRVVTLDDSNEDNELQVPAVKRRRVTAYKSIPPLSIGGKYVRNQQLFQTPAPQTPASRKALLEAQIEASSSAHVGSATAAATAIALAWSNQYAQAHGDDQASVPANAPTATGEAHVLASDALLQSTYPTDMLVDYWFCNHEPEPTFKSRFEALAAHRRKVKEFLKDVEPNLDWFEGPWRQGESELLWTGG